MCEYANVGGQILMSPWFRHQTWFSGCFKALYLVSSGSLSADWPSTWMSFTHFQTGMIGLHISLNINTRVLLIFGVDVCVDRGGGKREAKRKRTWHAFSEPVLFCTGCLSEECVSVVFQGRVCFHKALGEMDTVCV